MSQISNAIDFRLVALVVSVTATACLDATPAPNPTFPSAGAPGSGGSVGSSGAPAGGSGGETAGAGIGGAVGTAGTGGIDGSAGLGGAAAGAGGAATAGSSGAVGTAGTAGSAGAGAGYACTDTVTATADAFITKFDAATATSWGGDVVGLTGGYFAYPSPLLATVVDNSLHIAPTVTAYAGFALSFDHCVDASAAGGVSFSIKGSAGPTGKLLLSVLTNEDQAVDVVQMKRACVPAESDPSLAYKYCASPSKSITVTSAGSVVTAMWTDLMNGKPKPTVDPTQLVGLQWVFDWSGTSTPYPVDITVDDVKFIAKTN